MKSNFYISIVGQSNTGKSSLINSICSNYVTTESNKLQTTRMNLIYKVDYKEDVLRNTGGKISKRKSGGKVGSGSAFVASLYK